MLGAGALLVSTRRPGAGPAATPLTVGFIYVGPKDDYGYNQAHAQAAKALKAMGGLEITEEERVPETNAVEKTMESMINLDGATLLFPTSFGYYSPYLSTRRARTRRSSSAIAAASGPRRIRRTPAPISAISRRRSI